LNAYRSEEVGCPEIGDGYLYAVNSNELNEQTKETYGLTKFHSVYDIDLRKNNEIIRRNV